MQDFVDNFINVFLLRRVCIV